MGNECIRTQPYISTAFKALERARERKREKGGLSLHLGDFPVNVQTSADSAPPQRPPGWENHTQQETPLLDKVCGEVTVTDPSHPLYGQTLPLLLMRINRTPLHVMVLLPSGRRHMVPRGATDLEHPEGTCADPDCADT